MCTRPRLHKFERRAKRPHECLGARSSRECRSQFPLRHYLQQPNHFVERSDLISNASPHCWDSYDLGLIDIGVAIGK
jgi:hypothetical protein